ncbi:ABC-three component system middle component 2 [Cyclobacterium marinum]|uniref:ABC-three component system middle component 2 n=1 Tax=Cyclobacterium marinum TaxID=104 RepID=UPI0011EE2DF2|nr:ABC-three component system middle component 2 [Cyclobacterium marinum]MBI0401125.1 hypothetical protein [Cyclobacterium marinum]
MGEITKVYNSVIEIGMRALVILSYSPSISKSLDEIMILDHLALNTFDVGGPVSLHAPIPNRGVQVYSKSKILNKSIQLLLSKELITLSATSNGFKYSINESGKNYLSYFESKYFHLLNDRVQWTMKNFGQMDESQLKKVVNQNLANWGEEFMSKENSHLEV